MSATDIAIQGMETGVKRAQWLLLVLLLAGAAVAWVVLAQRGDLPGAGGSMDSMAMGGGATSDVLTMGMSMALFMGMWVLMMIAMMFPTAAPMVLAFARISQTRKERSQPYVPAWFFVASYLLVWSVLGVAWYWVSVGADIGGEHVIFLHDNATRIAGGVLIVAGLYQFSPWKNRCLTACRTPLHFIMNSWRDGWSGAFRMGASHGMYCFGCCVMLFVILIPLGMMNVAAMGLATLVIFAEKSLPRGEAIARLTGTGLIGLGLAVQFAPGVLPTTL